MPNILFKQNIEPLIFFICCIINLWPIIGVDFYTSLDGPAHIYNAQLINLTLLDNSEFITQFYTLNTVIVPNWTGHLLLAILINILPAKMVEKVFAAILVIALSYSFRNLLKSSKIEDSRTILFCYFIFPFTYSLTFLLGFYNFTIGLIILFFGISYWSSMRLRATSSLKVKLYLGILFLLLYFSHILPFIVFLIVILINEIVSCFLKKEKLETLLQRILAVLLASSFSFVCLFSFITFRNKEEKEYLFLGNDTLLEWILNLRSIIVFNSEMEVPYSTWVFYSITFMFLALLFKYLPAFNLNFNHVRYTEPFNQRVVWFIMFITFAIMYFVLPDNDGVGGEIIPRIQWLMFLFLIVFMSKFKYSKYLLYPTFVVVFFATFQLNSFYKQVQQSRGEVAEKFLDLRGEIKNKSIIHVINNQGNWTMSHFSNFLGLNKEVVLLKNYEADRGYFPIAWNRKNMPSLKIGEKTIDNFKNGIDWQVNQSGKIKKVDYILVQGKLKENKDSLLIEMIDMEYILQKETDEYELYTLRSL